MSDPEVRPRAEKEGEKKLSPVDRALADLPPGKYYKLTEVAQILGMSETWMRRMVGKPGIKAPTDEMVVGGMTVYLYTQDDVEELRPHASPRIRKR